MAKDYMWFLLIIVKPLIQSIEWLCGKNLSVSPLLFALFLNDLTSFFLSTNYDGPSLAAQLREDPSSMASRSTRRRVYSTMRLIRTGMLGQLASLQQWEEAMHRQDEQLTLRYSEHYAHTNNSSQTVVWYIYVDKFRTYATSRKLRRSIILHDHSFRHISYLGFGEPSLLYVISLHSCSHQVDLCIYV